MKIALLNLPFDNNYGGNLQRYALVKVLQYMGHDVVHIYLRTVYFLPWYLKPYSYLKRIIKKYIFRQDICILYEKYQNAEIDKSCEMVLPFYDHYIPHTTPVRSIKEIKQICKNGFDAYIVGSDQVWRKSMTTALGIKNYFFKFLDDNGAKRIAYAVSMDTSCCEFNNSDIRCLSKLYAKFDAVSVREVSALKQLNIYGWNTVKAEVTLDPTLLLSVDNYLMLVNSGATVNLTSDKIFAYVLDQTSDKLKIVKEKAKSMDSDYFLFGIETSDTTIEQWLNNIYHSKFVITDSYHGTVFSILFNKPFMFIGNERRGNFRIESLFSLLEIENTDNCMFEWQKYNDKISELQKKSFRFLHNALKS
ncbi:polysaccharide pyruvyl transferase family protein [Bacteroides sp. MSB163]|uniref:polysaccharide pyruvyl transferase family protein n=1 Tax=Bacteroides maternus TaxID=3117552 RepID=UPI002EDB66C0